MTKSKLITIVSPVHNEQEVVEEFVTRIKNVLIGESWELVLVDDGSTDNSYEVISKLAAQDKRIRPIKMSRNFGHQPAISCGIENANGSAVIIMDSDLQDPPEVLPKFIAEWRNGFDVVYGQRNSRNGESFFKKITAKVFYRFINSLSDTEFPVDTGDFRLIDRKVVDALNAMNEKSRYLRGMVAWVGFNQVGVKYDREPRSKGKTKFNLIKMLSFASDGVISFSTKPLKIANWISFIFAISAVTFGFYLIYQKIRYPDNSTPGFVTTIVIISSIASIQFFVIGIIGAYIGRIFKEVKNRPLYFIDK